MPRLIALIPLMLAAAAQPASASPPNETTQCIEASGRLVPAVCRVPGSRLDLREDICTCPNDGQPVKVAVCSKGETPPPEGRALNAARRTAARDGSLIGDTIGGKRICAPPRRP